MEYKLAPQRGLLNWRQCCHTGRWILFHEVSREISVDPRLQEFRGSLVYDAEGFAFMRNRELVHIDVAELFTIDVLAHTKTGDIALNLGSETESVIRTIADLD